MFEILVGHTNMHLFDFFVNFVEWLVMQYKVSPTNALWSPKDGPSIWLWQAVDSGHPKLLQGLPNHVPFCPIWGNDATKSIDKEKFINNKLFKYVEFWKMGMCKDESMLWSLVCMWLIGKSSLNYCQIHCPFKIQPSWKVHLPTIGSLIMCKVPIPPIVDVNLEIPIITPYCGPKNMRLSL